MPRCLSAAVRRWHTARAARLPRRSSFRLQCRRMFAIGTIASLVALPLCTAGCITDKNDVKNVGQIITQLQQSLDELLQHANGTLANAAVLVQAQVDHFSDVYNDDLDHTVDQLNGSVATTLQSLESLTNEVQAGITTDITQATNTLSTTIDQLPLVSHVPTITSFSPHYVVGGAPGNISFTVQGNFADDVLGGSFAPKLVLCAAGEDPGGTVCKDGTTIAAQVTTVGLVFTVPNVDFPQATAQDTPTTYAYLVADFKKGLFKLARGTAVAREAIVSVPPTVGSISLDPGPAVGRQITTGQVTTSGDGTQVYTNPAPVAGTSPLGADETVVPGTLVFHSQNGSGLWSYAFPSTSPTPTVTVTTGGSSYSTVTIAGSCPTDESSDIASSLEDVASSLKPNALPINHPPSGPLHVCTLHHDDPGRVTWWLTYEAVKADIAPKPLDLGWGSQVVYDIVPGKWTLNYSPFPASAELITGPLQISQPQRTDFLATSISDAKLTVAAANLKDVPYPPAFEGGS